MGGNHRADGSRRIIKAGGIIYGADPEIADWVAKRIPGYIRSPGAVALGVERKNRIVAGVIFERFNGANIEASIAADPGTKWADRKTLFRLFAYPFLQLGCDCITVLIALNNLPSLNLATKLGFNQIALVPFAAHDGVPLVILQQYRDQCRWLRHEQQGGRRAKAT